MDETLNKILSLIKEKRISKGTFLKDLGFNKSAISDWIAGKSKSYLKQISDIAAYFGVSTDYLLGNEQKNKPAAESDELGPKGRVIWERLKQIKAVSEEDYELAVAQLDLLLSRRDKKDKN